MARVPAVRLALAGGLSAAMATAAAGAPQDPPPLSTTGRPFAALPVEHGLIVSESGDEADGTPAGLGIYAGDGAALMRRCFLRLPARRVFGLAAVPGHDTIIIAAGYDGVMLVPQASLSNDCGGEVRSISMGCAGSHQGSLDIVVTRDGRFAFVANEYGVVSSDAAGQDIRGHVAVVELRYGADGHAVGGRIVQRIATGGSSIAGLALSPDEQRLYVTSEVARPGARLANVDDPRLAPARCREGGQERRFGMLSVVDTAKAVAGARDAVLAATAAGCSPVRVAATPDGKTLWITDRADNLILALSAAAVERDPRAAFVSAVDSGGIAPVGLLLLDGGASMAVANSNRFARPAAPGNLAWFDTSNPAAPKLMRNLPAGLFPRSVSPAHDGQALYLTNFLSKQIQTLKQP